MIAGTVWIDSVLDTALRKVERYATILITIIILSIFVGDVFFFSQRSIKLQAQCQSSSQTWRLLVFFWYPADMCADQVLNEFDWVRFARMDNKGWSFQCWHWCLDREGGPFLSRAWTLPLWHQKRILFPLSTQVIIFLIVKTNNTGAHQLYIYSEPGTWVELGT